MLGFSVDVAQFERFKKFLDRLNLDRVVGALAFIISTIAIIICWQMDIITLYGDAESHLNLSKRVLNSITPGLAQLGGIWLPLPHVLMFPFIWVDYFWYTGLAGSFVSGGAFVVSSIYIYKLSHFITKSKLAGFVAFIVFALNPNMLYLQSTPMTEPLLLCFFVLSSYFFIRYLYSSNNFVLLLLASVFAFCASVTRYDGWFLVMMQGFLIGVFYIVRRKPWEELIGKGILYGALASFGILLWFLWCYLILGDPFYFKDSEYSARTQQLEWQERGQLPSYHNPLLAFGYFFVSSMSNDGMLPFFVSLVGVYYFVFMNKDWKRFLVFLLIVAPFIFNTITLFAGQSIIFIPHLTPIGFDWRLFNVRYGIVMLPAVAFFFSYLFSRINTGAKLLIIFLFVLQLGLFGIGYSKILSYEDGATGLSSAKRGDTEVFMRENYDGGMVLMDDYARSVSVIGARFPMQSIIYVGNKPYWAESLKEPEKYARWVVIQENDAIWAGLWVKPGGQGRLYKYFQKVYTSPDVMIFKRNYNIKSPYDDMTMEEKSKKK